MGEHNWRESIPVLTEIIRLEKDPNEKAKSFNSLGVAYGAMEKYDLCIANFCKAIEQNHDYANAYYNRGIAYQKKGEYDCAISDYNETIKLEPEASNAFYNRGVAYLCKGEYDGAISDFAKAEKFDEALKLKHPAVYLSAKICNIFNNKKDRIEAFALYGELLFTVMDIQEYLFCSPQKNVAHYTTLHVLKKLSNAECFRLYNSLYVNDPEEGRVIFDIIEMPEIGKMLYEGNASSSPRSPVYIGSFIEPYSEKQQDELFLWRTYGKHDLEDAAGACLIFETTCFAEKYRLLLGAMRQSGSHVNGDVKIDAKEESYLPMLYKVCYRDKNGKQADEKLQALLGDSKSCLNAVQQHFLDGVDCREELKSLTREILDGIRFLFKESHYKGENEVRIVDIHYDSEQDASASDSIKVDMEQFPPRLYIEVPKSFRFNEVMLGPKTRRISEWRRWLKEQNANVVVTQSAIKYGHSY